MHPRETPAAVTGARPLSHDGSSLAAAPPAGAASVASSGAGWSTVSTSAPRKAGGGWARSFEPSEGTPAPKKSRWDISMDEPVPSANPQTTLHFPLPGRPSDPEPHRNDVHVSEAQTWRSQHLSRPTSTSSDSRPYSSASSSQHSYSNGASSVASTSAIPDCARRPAPSSDRLPPPLPSNPPPLPPPPPSSYNLGAAAEARAAPPRVMKVVLPIKPPGTRDFRVTYDPVLDPSAVKKSKELVYKYADEGTPGPVLDPRLQPKKSTDKPVRQRLNPVKTLNVLEYAWDKNSTGKPPPPPPSAVLVTGFPGATTADQIHRHFAAFGRIELQEIKIDKQTGGSLGICWIKFMDDQPRSADASRDQKEQFMRDMRLGTAQDGNVVALEAVKRANGAKIGPRMIGVSTGVKVVLDGNKTKCGKSVDEEMLRRHPPPKAAPPPPPPLPRPLSSSSSSYPSAPSSSYPSSRLPPHSNGASDAPSSSYRSPRRDDRRDAPSSYRSPRGEDRVQSSSSRYDDRRPLQHALPIPSSSSRQPMSGVPPPSTSASRYLPSAPGLPTTSSQMARVPSGYQGGATMMAAAVAAAALLATQKHLAREEQSRGKPTADVVVDMEIDSGSETEDKHRNGRRPLEGANRRSARSFEAAEPVKAVRMSGWTDAELVNEARDIVIRDLLDVFRNDVRARVVTGKVRATVTAWQREEARVTALPTVLRAPSSAAMFESKPTIQTLKSLPSFGRRKARPVEASSSRPLAIVTQAAQVVSRVSSEAPSESLATPTDEYDSRSVASEEPPSRPKPVKTKLSKVKPTESEEESDDGHEAFVQRIKDSNAKKARSKVKAAFTSSEEEDVSDEERKSSSPFASPAARAPKSLKRGRVTKPAPRARVKPVRVEEPESGEDYLDSPGLVDEKPFLPDPEPVYAPSPSPVLYEPELDPVADEVVEIMRAPPAPRMLVPRREPLSAIADPFEEGVAEDEEDLFYLKLAIERPRTGEDLHPAPPLPVREPYTRHTSGSARTEGFYIVTSAEKLASRPSANKMAFEAPVGGASGVAVSRLARANTRGLVRGMELHKKFTATDTDVLKFNQLRTRKKQLSFSRSGIHDYGLFALEHIPVGEMVIEYVGELVRQQVADRREKAYERQGIGSSYLFRVDEDLVVDATKKGNLGRLINHCCAPNCNARIITIMGEKKIVIYAKTNIEAGDEVTYDYHFPHEEIKIPCLCGHPLCRKYLN